MTAIKTTVTLDSLCTLTVSDISGFYDSGTNVTGFLVETDVSAIALNKYKLSQGYFLNVLLYDKYSATATVSNPSETSITIATNVVDNTTYSNNFIASTYPLVKDGTYTLSRFFIPSVAFYNANHTNAIYTGKTMYYTDGTSIYQVITGTPTVITLATFLAASLTNSNCLVTSTTFISTCNMNACYFKTLSTILDINTGVCDKTLKYNELVQNRDLLYMSMEAIKYLEAQNSFTQVQKLIEVVTACNGICGTTYLNAITDCGCHG